MRFLNYEAVESVRRSLESAGFPDFRVRVAEEPLRWFRHDWFLDFLKGTEHRSVPLIWDGRALEPHDTLKVVGRGIQRIERADLFVLRREMAVAMVNIVTLPGGDMWILLVGENRDGVIARWMEEYWAYARKRAREEPVILSPDEQNLPRPLDLDWDSLTLPSELESAIRAELDGFFTGAEFYRRLGLQHRRGFLFAGPPGNGKTSLLRVIASRYRVPFILVSSFLGSQMYFLNRAFQMATFHAPAILCFEDVDTLFRNEVTLSHFLNRIDGIEPLDGVLLLATTNHPATLDPALKDRPSRFDRVWVLPNPGIEERTRYLSRQFGDAFDERLARETDGFSFAHLKEIWLSACFESLRRGEERLTIEAADESIRQLRSQRDRVERNGTAHSIGFNGRAAR